jgi:hypothetical protein
MSVLTCSQLSSYRKSWVIHTGALIWLCATSVVSAQPSPEVAPQGAAVPSSAPEAAMPSSDPAAVSAAPAVAAELQPSAAPAPEPAAAPVFADFGGASVDDSALSIKAYGDTELSVRNKQPVHATFAAAHLDLFMTADVGRLSFLSEVFFEPEDNEMHMDLERLQINYLFDNWLRLRAGRMHTAFGYYNDTYHHGNLFELGVGRPFSVRFEDEGGLFTAHLVGVGADGTFAVGDGGSLRYDVEVGNGRYSDVSVVALEQAAKDDKLVNVRLRYSPFDGFIFGINGQHDTVPAFDSMAGLRPKASELTLGAHVVYMNDPVHLLIEGYMVNHDTKAAKSTTTAGGFVELGYKLGDFKPYGRAELIHFPRAGDVIYQAPDASYAGTRNLVDLRVGLRYQPLVQLAFRVELERVARDGNHQESATFKAAFGF